MTAQRVASPFIMRIVESALLLPQEMRTDPPASPVPGVTLATFDSTSRFETGVVSVERSREDGKSRLVKSFVQASQLVHTQFVTPAVVTSSM